MASKELTFDTGRTASEFEDLLNKTETIDALVTQAEKAEIGALTAKTGADTAWTGAIAEKEGAERAKEDALGNQITREIKGQVANMQGSAPVKLRKFELLGNTVQNIRTITVNATNKTMTTSGAGFDVTLGMQSGLMINATKFKNAGNNVTGAWISLSEDKKTLTFTGSSGDTLVSEVSKEAILESAIENLSNIPSGEQEWASQYGGPHIFPDNPKVLLDANSSYTIFFDYNIELVAPPSSYIYTSIGYGATAWVETIDEKEHVLLNLTSGTQRVVFTTPAIFDPGSGVVETPHLFFTPFSVRGKNSGNSVAFKGSYGNVAIYLGNVKARQGTDTPISPDNPAEILSVVIPAEIVKSGKNLIHNSRGTSTIGGVTFTVNADKSITMNGTPPTSGVNLIYFFDPAKIHKGKTYTMSGIIRGGHSAYALEIVVGGYYHQQATTPTTFTATKDAVTRPYIFVRSGSGTLNNVTIYPQIEHGNTATTYEPHKSSTHTIPLKDTEGNLIELEKVGDVADRVFLDVDGVWKVEKKISTLVFDGTENWNDMHYENFGFIFLDAGRIFPNANTDGICNYFNVTKTDMLNSPPNSMQLANPNMSTDKKYVTLYLRNTEFKDMEIWKQWLVDKHTMGVPVEVVFPHITPQTITLHIDTQTALNTLYNEPLYDGTTVMFGTDNVAPTLNVVYVESLNYYAQTQLDMAGTLATKPIKGIRIGQRYYANDQTPVQAFDWTGTGWIQLQTV